MGDCVRFDCIIVTADGCSCCRFIGLHLEDERRLTRAKHPDEWLWKYSPYAK